jgi:hypothetical protein
MRWSIFLSGLVPMPPRILHTFQSSENAFFHTGFSRKGHYSSWASRGQQLFSPFLFQHHSHPLPFSCGCRRLAVYLSKALQRYWAQGHERQIDGCYWSFNEWDLSRLWRFFDPMFFGWGYPKGPNDALTLIAENTPPWYLVRPQMEEQNTMNVE